MVRRRIFSWVFFTDLLFNMVVGLVCLLFLALLLINPIKDNKKIDPKAEFVVTMEWTRKSNADVDLHLLDPLGNKTGYQQKENGVVVLERDDTGLSTDTQRVSPTQVIYNPENSEIITIRANIEGEWVVNVHYYASRPIPPNHPSGWKDEPYGDPARIAVEVEVKVIKLNPRYKEISVKKILLTHNKEERTMVRFTTDQDGNVTDINYIPMPFVPAESNFNSTGP